MAKMTDKKPGKAKPKAKAKTSSKAKAKAKAAAAHASHAGQAQAISALVPEIRQPGVERRPNHPARAKHGYAQILLTQAVPHVGQPGDLVKVRPGFARNYLLPQGMATFATPHNLRIVEKHRKRLRELEEARRADLLGLAAQIGRREIHIEANANDEGHLYGSVSAEQIAAALRAYNLPVEENHVRIDGPLKETGQYMIKIQLGQDVDTEVKLWVIPTHAEEPVA